MIRPILNSHPAFVAEGGYYREEAIMLLRRFYMSENSNGKSFLKLLNCIILASIHRLM